MPAMETESPSHPLKIDFFFGMVRSGSVQSSPPAVELLLEAVDLLVSPLLVSPSFESFLRMVNPGSLKPPGCFLGLAQLLLFLLPF